MPKILQILEEKNMYMLTEEFTNNFIQSWIDAWNSHDLNRVLIHYTDNVRFISPLIQLTYPNTYCLIGKHHLRTYWENILQNIPELKFTSIISVPGVNSVCAAYLGVNDTYVMETMILNKSGKISTSYSHFRHSKSSTSTSYVG